MCGGPERLKPANPHEEAGKGKRSENQPNKVSQMQESCTSLHELAANNDLIGFKKAMEEDGSKIDEISLWYGRQNGSNQMVLEQRTPLMVAALYGSVDVMGYMLSIYATCGADVNQVSGFDNSTALHCAAAGGSARVLETVKLLLQCGADVNCVDANGRKPADLITVAPRLAEARSTLEKLLNPTGEESSFLVKKPGLLQGAGGKVIDPIVTSCVHSSSPKSSEAYINCSEGNEKREYPVDPSIPDIKNSIYATDEFRMFSFKVKPCSRAYSHDWTECPFVHPGENARRRDPRKYHYSCVPCPDFRKGSCRRGDACEYAHGVFECWLHPAQYRTRLCKDGTNCTRRVCFFAHTSDELRPLFVSTGSAVPSPRASSSSLDMSTVMSPVAPGSPSSVAMLSPFLSNQHQASVLTPPMSPSAPSVNGISHSSICGGWPQPNVPTLHLPGNNIQSSRLRTELNARDVPFENSPRLSDYEGQLLNSSRLSEYEGQILNDFSPLSTQVRKNAATAVLSGGASSTRSGKYKSLGINGVPPTNLEDMFATEVSSPRVAVRESSMFSQMSPQMQPIKASGHPYATIPNQMLPPINTKSYSQGLSQVQQSAIEPQSPGHSLMQSPFHSTYGMASPSRMSPRCMEVERHNTNGSSLSPMTAVSLNSRAAALIQRDKRSHSSRELGANVPPSAWSEWGSSTGKVDWGIHVDDLSKLRKSASLGPRSYEEPDLSWVQTLVKESTPDGKDATNAANSAETPKNVQIENVDHSVLGAWIEQMQLDQIVA
eukprot:TRINITY_DN1739_c0_g1_i2.p1 TRINITY_DN1739_c0_g1~~TRINITY_DN1739_c0_g1_i2.p1  ORF type:complete len:774 (-),score=144.47 TRINITY_DN1739_c0_g1_i2:736-3057(-)